MAIFLFFLLLLTLDLNVSLQACSSSSPHSGHYPACNGVKISISCSKVLSYKFVSWYPNHMASPVPTPGEMLYCILCEWVLGQPGFHRENLSQKTKQNNKNSWLLLKCSSTNDNLHSLHNVHWKINLESTVSTRLMIICSSRENSLFETDTKALCQNHEAFLLV